MATWAINLVLADVNNIMRRFDMGEVGVNNEETQQIVLLNRKHSRIRVITVISVIVVAIPAFFISCIDIIE
jgi:hypothetical protein